MALPKEILYREIPRHLPLSSVRSLALTSRQGREAVTLEQCCSLPSRQEIIDELVRIISSPEELSRLGVGESQLVYRQAGVTYQLIPNEGSANEGAYWTAFVKGEDVKDLYTREQIEKYVLRPKLIFEYSNTIHYARILGRRGSCLSAFMRRMNGSAQAQIIPDYIGICILRWFKEEAKRAILNEKFNRNTLHDLFEALEPFAKDTEIIDEYVKEINIIIAKFTREFRQHYTAEHFLRLPGGPGIRVPEIFFLEGRKILLERITPVLDKLSPEDFDFTRETTLDNA